MELPREVRQHIKRLASGILPPTPAAAIMKHARLSYECETDDDYGVYHPDRLIVAAIPPARFIDKQLSPRRPPYDCARVYILHDLLPYYPINLKNSTTFLITRTILQHLENTESVEFSW